MTLAFLPTFIQISNAIMQSRSRERSFRNKCQSVSSRICHCPPTDIRLRSTFLRTDIRIILVAHLLAIDTQRSAMITVGIIFNRSTSVISDCLKALWHSQVHSETEHIRNLSARSRFHRLYDFYFSFIINQISKREGSRNFFHLIFRTDFSHAVLLCSFQ